MKRLGAAVLVAALVVLGGGFAAGAQDSTTTTAPLGTNPSLRTEKGSYDRGETMRVEGKGWPASALLTVELCGNEARNGSIDCDARTSQTVATTRDGILFADLLATSPPSPCPCVVHVFQPQGILDMAVRVRINGVPVAPLTEDAGPKRNLEVTDAHLTGGNGLGAWFGAGPERTLELTVKNTGDVAIDGAAIRAGWGRSSSPDQPIDVADLKKTIEPGDEVTVEVPVQMGALSLGKYVAEGSIAGFEDSDFQASTSTYPYGLVLVLLLVVLAIGLLIYRRLGSPDDDVAAADEGATPTTPSSATTDPAPPAASADAAGDASDPDAAKVPV